MNMKSVRPCKIENVYIENSLSPSMCNSCGKMIENEEIRIGISESEELKNADCIRMLTRWHHLNCFSVSEKMMKKWEDGFRFEGFATLRKDDQELVNTHFGSIDSENEDKPMIEESEIDESVEEEWILKPPKERNVEQEQYERMRRRFTIFLTSIFVLLFAWYIMIM